MTSKYESIKSIDFAKANQEFFCSFKSQSQSVCHKKIIWMSQKKFPKSKSIVSEKSDKSQFVSAKYVIKILPLMNHQPFFALLKVKLNSVCHKKIIDCLQKKTREKKTCLSTSTKGTQQ